MAQDKGLSSLDKVMIAARAADSKKATDILIQDVRELVGITDFFVIVTAQNNRQISAVLDAIEEAEIKEAGVKPFSVEGAQEGFWGAAGLRRFRRACLPARRARLLSSRGDLERCADDSVRFRERDRV